MANAGIKTNAAGTAGVLTFGTQDVVEFDGSGITAGAGRRLAQIVSFSTNAYASGTAVIPVDDTIPQITEGNQYMSLVITPTNALSTLEIAVEASFGSPSEVWISVALFKVGVSDALTSRPLYLTAAATMLQANILHSVAAGSVLPQTFTVRGGAHTTATVGINGTSTRLQGGAIISRITIKEYLP